MIREARGKLEIFDMGSIWLVRIVTNNPKYVPGSAELMTKWLVTSFDEEKEATALYELKVKEPLSPELSSREIYLERSDAGSHPPRRIDTFLRLHWTYRDKDGVLHSNDMSRIVQV